MSFYFLALVNVHSWAETSLYTKRLGANCLEQEWYNHLICSLVCPCICERLTAKKLQSSKISGKMFLHWQASCCFVRVNVGAMRGSWFWNVQSQQHTLKYCKFMLDLQRHFATSRFSNAKPQVSGMLLPCN